MGTRGHIYIRCRGRYFIYYNQFDSYPEGLGEAIVVQIPEDPEEYRKWLESMRAIFTRIAQEFEELHLPVAVEVGQEDVEVSESDLYSKCFLALDDKLELPPLQTMSCNHLHNLFIEFTYTLDLDREIFTVDDAAHFQLSKIPKIPRGEWINYVTLDSSGRRILGPDTPKDIIGDVEWRPGSQAEGVSLPESTVLKIVTPKTSIDTTGTHHQHLLLATFKTFRGTYRELLERYILQWNPDGFSFREMSFAILSLAAGEVAFECPKVLDRAHRDDGYYLIPDKKLQPQKQKLLPQFLHENHVPGVESGSAPTGSTFWFNNVLVYLTSRLDLVDVEQASVAKAVRAGLDQGLKSFNALVFSILDFVLIQVDIGNDGAVLVKRSPLMVLFYFDDAKSHQANGPRSRCDSTSSRSEIESSSFVALMRFFNAAANRSLIGTKSSILPNEVLTIIMQFSDTQTYHMLAKVSSYCRKMALAKFRLDDDYAVVSMQEKPGHFVLEDVHSGDKIETVLESHENDPLGGSLRGEKDGLELNPVIGLADVNRTSIMSLITLIFSNVAPKGPLYTKKGRFPKQAQHSQFFWSSDNTVYGAEPIWNIPDYVHSGFVEEAWGRYLTEKLKGNNGFTMPIAAASYRCLLPPRYRQLKSDFYYKNEFQAVVRHTSEETPEEWEKSQEYAIRESARTEYHCILGRGRQEHSQGCFVVVAFGSRFKLFYYVYHNANPDFVSPATDNSYSKEIAARITDPDPMNRLIQISSDEILDLREDKAREYLEHWLGLIRGSYFDKKVFYDPIVDKYVPVPVPKKVASKDEDGKNKDEDEDEGEGEEENEQGDEE